MSLRNDARRAAQMPQWPGETVFILGGGPSLRDFDADRLRGQRVIGVNEAGLTMAPWCDVLFWADRRWADWNVDKEDRIALHTGDYRMTCNAAFIERIPRVRLINWRYRDPQGRLTGFVTDPGTVSGFDAGGRCINLAWHMGATRVILLGFDCHDFPIKQWRRGNWHTAHHLPPLADQRADKFIPAHNAMAEKIRELDLGLEVINATPGSALTCWPLGNLEDYL